MADQYSGNMLIGLDDVVTKTATPHYEFPQPGVFTLDIVPYFSIEDRLPIVLLTSVVPGINGSKATGIILPPV
jgi:hypothetical protein